MSKENRKYHMTEKDRRMKTTASHMIATISYQWTRHGSCNPDDDNARRGFDPRGLYFAPRCYQWASGGLIMGIVVVLPNSVFLDMYVNGWLIGFVEILIVVP